jgi:hypothetical protein
MELLSGLLFPTVLIRLALSISGCKRGLHKVRNAQGLPTGEIDNGSTAAGANNWAHASERECWCGACIQAAQGNGGGDRTGCGQRRSAKAEGHSMAIRCWNYPMVCRLCPSSNLLAVARILILLPCPRFKIAEAYSLKNERVSGDTVRRRRALRDCAKRETKHTAGPNTNGLRAAVLSTAPQLEGAYNCPAASAL